jgi:hypothetical protein
MAASFPLGTDIPVFYFVSHLNTQACASPKPPPTIYLIPTTFRASAKFFLHN